MRRMLRPFFVLVLACVVIGGVSVRTSRGQGGIAGGGGGLGGGGVGGGLGNQGQGGGNTNFPGGILIDADGVVTAAVTRSGSARLSKKRLEAIAQGALSADVTQPSPLRKVSLVRLEAAMEPYIRSKEHVPDEMQFLAGLQRIDYVFVYPESNDLVIAGPGEGFAPDGFGRCVGTESHRPPLRLDDLIVALRSVRQSSSLGCSIDPVQDRLAAMNRYVAQNSSPTTPDRARQRYQQMARVLGMHDVRVWGVPPDSHFGQILVEADYQMKRIMMGIIPSKVRGVSSYLSMLTPQGNCMQRFWFTPKYEAVFKTEDANAYQLAGPRAQLFSQEELVSATGQRTAAATTRKSTQRFAREFTDQFPKLADTWPVFAELQNLIDLSILAALLTKDQLPEKVGWHMESLLDEQRIPLVTGTVPRQTPSLFTARRATRGMLIGLVCGGVDIDTVRTLNAIDFRSDEGKRLEGVRQSALAPQPPEAHPWWWD